MVNKVVINDLSLIVGVVGMTNYGKRLKGLQGLMEEKGLDLVVMGVGSDFQYLTGTMVKKVCEREGYNDGLFERLQERMV